MPRRADAFRGLAHASRLRVMDAVLASPGVGLAELAERTGLHENTLRDHVRVLEAEGLILASTAHRGTRGRPPTVYHPVRGEHRSAVAERRIEAAKRHGDLLRRVVPEADAADLEPPAQHQLDALYEHLDDVGLSPEVDERSLAIDLVPCPFHSLVAQNRDVVCHVHEELIRVVLEQAGGPVELDRLLPYVTEHACRVELRRAHPGADGTPAQ